MAIQIHHHGQTAWQRDEGHDCGYFHTYDNLQLDPGQDLPRKVHVFLPHNHDHHTDRYPVVYMNDGNTTFWPGGLSPYAWEVPQVLSKLDRQQTIPPVISTAAKNFAPKNPHQN
ncbi:hypothetical protein Pse7367_1942 [Thalassoporum mexicanum PCC 7367]|uniref:hypothetical protein n=1 Tax=Thalassoporum mexicanum TaxID=3457544 RepID=UPI00029FAF00|nr:hypothetical protein [Pseudanabaena sp. PCC 7367]AFY70217.1 hypothetical protein Pse7367_1942 [Pseudanabaena sp. PCC 7367]